jgi:hypothetical protein
MRETDYLLVRSMSASLLGERTPQKKESVTGTWEPWKRIYYVGATDSASQTDVNRVHGHCDASTTQHVDERCYNTWL